jgi:hypothetical protein
MALLVRSLHLSIMGQLKCIEFCREDRRAYAEGTNRFVLLSNGRQDKGVLFHHPVEG